MKPLGDLFNILFKKLFLSSFRIRKRLTVRGRTNIPAQGRAVIASLHRYDFDPLLISSMIDRHIYWVYGSFLDHVPLFRFLLRRYGFLTAAYEGITGVHSIRQMDRILREDKILGIFPEGVAPLISRDYAKKNLLFHTSFARLAVKRCAPVIPVIIVPRRYRITRYPIPRAIRRFFRMPPAIRDIPHRMRFLRADIIVGRPIHPPRPAGSAPPSPRETRKEAEALAEEVKGVLMEMDHRYNRDNYQKEWS